VSGDWLGVDHSTGEDLWTLVIDVTAHGFPSYVTAKGVSELWRSPRIVEMRESRRSPHEVLGVMSQELVPRLPDEVFVEAALGRFTAAGEAHVAGAGICRVILRRAGQQHMDLRRIGGHLLGSFWGNDHDQQSWSLLTNDELTIASDGLFEQPDERGCELEKSIIQRIQGRLAPGRNLHNALVEVLGEIVGDVPRGDDISVISVLRRDEVRP
jgi:serine phosphatase RsbU (regulator of sigma subunit)